MRKLTRRFLPSIALLIASSGLAGCLSDVGECDPAAAHEVVFLDTGTNVDAENGWPMYAGQALMARSCGNGQFCHSEGIAPSARYGAPHPLNFGFSLLCTDGPCRAFQGGMNVLRRSQEDALDQARLVLKDVEFGSMPPGDVGDELLARAPNFVRTYPYPGAYEDLREPTFDCADLPAGTCAQGQTTIALANELLPSVNSAAGHEILRNWLACGAPIVESTGDPGALVTGGDCSIPGELGHVGDCVVRIPAPITPPAQSWFDIYDKVIKPRCGLSCHNPSDGVNFERSQLDLSTASIAYVRIVGQFASGQECAGSDLPLVDPGNPDGSLFLQKIERTSTCGDPMPTGSSSIAPEVTAVIRAWIAAGAMND